MTKKLLLISAVLIATVMALSAFTVLGVHNVASNQATTNVTPSATASNHLTGREAQISNELLSKGVPATAIFLPDLSTGIHRTPNGLIGPSYGASPAPFGVGAYGLQNVNGNLQAFNMTTGSFSATINVSSLQEFYAYIDGPTTVTMQLNAVLDNVALFGNANYSFWTQNVLLYSARTHTLSFEDNLWNFSSSQFNLTPNSLYSYDGTPVAPEFYYAIGPSIPVTSPFSVTMFLNTTLVDGRSTVFYNYSVTTGGVTNAGSYDEIQFNSTPANDPSYVAPAPQYLISGNTVTPDGYIPYDAEIMLGGAGDGSTAQISALNATMQLDYLNSTTNSYVSVPDTYDVGSETGETSTGVAVSWNQATHVAHLTAGPAYVYGMWGINNNLPMYSYSGSVSPSNAFVFASPGDSFNASVATQIPVSQNGGYSFVTPIPTLASEVMLSGYTPESLQLNPGSNGLASMQMNPGTGDYTPLYASDSQQLAAISTTVYMHGQTYYVLDNTPSYMGGLSPLFGSVNDYFFPSYNGVLLSGVSNAVVYNLPQMQVTYEGENALLAAYYGTPMSNDLGIVLYETSNVLVENNFVSGFFQASLTELPVANLLLWNAQNTTVAGNLFYTMDSAMLVYNTQTEMGNNVIFGNYFQQDNSMNSTQYSAIDVSPTLTQAQSNPVGLTVYSNDNLIFGNAFGTYVTAQSPNYTVYTGEPATYVDSWNLGFIGNSWWNYHGAPGFAFFGNMHFHHHMMQPYNNDGLITSGYDFAPSHLPGRPPVNYLD